MASNAEAHAKKMERTMFLQPALNFDETYRQALARVQFMKTRYAKFFEPDEDGYTYYGRAKKHISKFEYNHRKMLEMETTMTVAYGLGDSEGYKKAQSEEERYMKNALYAAFAIGQLYTHFVKEAPNGLLQGNS